MGFPRKLLNDNEELVLDLRPHWLFLAPAVVLLVVAVAAGIVVSVLGPDGTVGTVLLLAAIVLLAVALLYLAYQYARWTTTNFVLTSDRLLTRRGILAKAGTEIPLERINTVFFKQSVFERIVGAGDLVIESAGERGSESFTDIRKPAVVQREIYVQMEDNENRKFDRVRAPGPGGLSVAEQLEKLHGLVLQGVLTPAQFDAEKAKLLGS
ncbi:MAG: PH domain-containing protein [Acidimicrobiales bacterium]